MTVETQCISDARISDVHSFNQHVASRPAGTLEGMTGMNDSRQAFEALQQQRASLEGYRKRFIGLSAGDARRLAGELKLNVRIMDLDADEWHTPDIRHDRLTLDVKDGRVADAEVV